MAGSGEKVNYSVRTSKSIERKMMCEIIGCLEHITSVKDYRYIGMGAKFFTDFVLMHKKFGISEMLSLETKRSPEEVRRFNFNKPYNCIQIEFKNTTEWLNSTNYKWKDKNDIIWFDYDGSLRLNQITDIALAVKKVKSCSIIFASTNIDFLKNMKEEKPKERLETYCSLINEEAFTKHLTVKDFAGEAGIMKTIADTFNIAIEDAVVESNKVKTNQNNKIYVDQIAYFTYSDSFTQMITLGWIIYTEFHKDAIHKCGIDKLPFYRGKGLEPYNITVPVLTYKEISVLNKNMPEYQYPIEEAPFLTKDEVDEYSKIYRYYPTTIETGLVL